MTAEDLAAQLAAHGVPSDAPGPGARRIVMVSTHGYWSDPPPAGATDTGGQTLYVLQISKEWAQAGREVVILVRWFAPAPRVEQLAPRLWLVRVPAGGEDFVRKEALYPLAPALAEHATEVARQFRAQAVMGHYADGMAVAAEIATRLALPFVAMPHSLALTKIGGLGRDPGALATWFDDHYQFDAREEYERAALRSADAMIGCLPDQLDVVPRVYGIRTRREVVPPGVAPVFLAAGDPGEDVARFGLEPGRYLIVTGRLAETKNIPGAVALLGELRALAPARFAGVVLAVVGGNAEPREAEERAVAAAITAAMARHGLAEHDVRRVPAQSWPVVAQLLRHALFYVGMQHFEPFGMGAAEALAVGAPVLLSRRAGIARALHDGCAVLVDPSEPRTAARRLLQVLDDPAQQARMVAAGRALARERFSWAQGAAKLAALLDELARAPRPERGHHRLASAWRGDRPRIASQHAWSAEQLVPRIVEAQRQATGRLIVAIGGESGAGKTEIAHCLAIALRRHPLWAALLPGDVFFRLPPRANHEARLAAAAAGTLADYIGPPREIDLAGLDAALAAARDPRTGELHSPSDCRTLGARRYPRVPLALAHCQVVIVDLTYAMQLETPALRIFLDSDFAERREYIRRRNTARDPDQDFAFIEQVLAIEHAQISRTAARAHLRVDLRGEVYAPALTQPAAER